MKFANIVAPACVAALHAVAFAAADPADPKAPVPRATYQSPFKNYSSLGDAKPAGWKAANDAVEQIGGWRAYAEEAHQESAAPSAVLSPIAPVTRPMPAPAEAPARADEHSGHAAHKKEGT